MTDMHDKWLADKAFWSTPGRPSTFDIEDCGSGYLSYRDMVKQPMVEGYPGEYVLTEDYRRDVESLESKLKSAEDELRRLGYGTEVIDVETKDGTGFTSIRGDVSWDTADNRARVRERFHKMLKAPIKVYIVIGSSPALQGELQAVFGSEPSAKEYCYYWNNTSRLNGNNCVYEYYEVEIES